MRASTGGSIRGKVDFTPSNGPSTPSAQPQQITVRRHTVVTCFTNIQTPIKVDWDSTEGLIRCLTHLAFDASEPDQPVTALYREAVTAYSPGLRSYPGKNNPRNVYRKAVSPLSQKADSASFESDTKSNLTNRIVGHRRNPIGVKLFYVIAPG